MTTEKKNEDGATNEAKMQIDGDATLIATEATDNAKSSNDRKHCDHLMVFKVNHCA